jgi:hypothetical protein
VFQRAVEALLAGGYAQEDEEEAQAAGAHSSWARA